MVVDGDDSFKRPGAVPFNWEIRPGVPKTRNPQPDDPTPKKLAPLRLKPLPPPSSSESKSRPVSPFAPPSSFELEPPPDSDSHSSGPPTPYFRSSSRRAGVQSGGSLRRYFPKSLFGLKKSKKPGQDSTSSESDNFYESETTEGSSKGSVSTRWGSPKSSLSSLRGSPLVFFSMWQPQQIQMVSPLICNFFVGIYLRRSRKEFTGGCLMSTVHGSSRSERLYPRKHGTELPQERAETSSSPEETLQLRLGSLPYNE